MTLSEAHKLLAKSFKNGVYLEPADKSNWNTGGGFYLSKSGSVYGIVAGSVSKPCDYRSVERDMPLMNVKNNFVLTSVL